MAVLDISSRLGKEKPTIKLAEDKIFVVNNSADLFLEMNERLDKENLNVGLFYEIIEKVLGNEALTYIKTMELSFSELMVVLTAIMAQIQEIPYEEMEKRFQDNMSKQ